MKIILLKDTPKVGKKYDVKDVSDGYGLNLLIPKGFAIAATAQAVNRVELLRANDMTQKKIQGELLLKNLEVIKNLTITLKEKANDKGHLFAGVTKEMLTAEILKVSRLNIDPESIKLDKPIKETGEHKVTIEAMGHTAPLTVVIN